MPRKQPLLVAVALVLAWGIATPFSPEPDIALDGVRGFCVVVDGYDEAYDPTLNKVLESEFTRLLAENGLDVVSLDVCLDGPQYASGDRDTLNGGLLWH